MRSFLIAVLLISAVAAGAAQSTPPDPKTLPAGVASRTQGINTNSVTSARTDIAAGDFLAVAVFDVPELAQNVRVDVKGNADLMLLGQVHLAGINTEEAQNLVRKRLQDGGYVLDPRVSVEIREYASLTAGGALSGTAGVSVVGEVARPGFYPVAGKRTLVDVIADAGGPTTAASQQITVNRSVDHTVLHASLSNNPGELLASNIELQAGDIVIVPKGGIAYILGDVGRPGGFVMQDQGKMSLLQLVALGGGPNRTASLGHTMLLRRTPEGMREEEIDLKKIMQGKKADIGLNTDDVLFVPNSALKNLIGSSTSSLLQSAAGAAVYSGIAYH